MIMLLPPKNRNFKHLFTWMVDIVMAMITSIHQARKNYMVLFIKIRDTVMVMIPKGQLLKNHLPFQSCQEANINIRLESDIKIPRLFFDFLDHGQVFSFYIFVFQFKHQMDLPHQRDKKAQPVYETTSSHHYSESKTHKSDLSRFYNSNRYCVCVYIIYSAVCLHFRYVAGTNLCSTRCSAASFLF